MAHIKNEYFIYAYGERGDKPGEYVLILGLTDAGIDDYLRKKLTLVLDLPRLYFTHVVIYNEKDKASLKALLNQMGVPVSEKH